MDVDALVVGGGFYGCTIAAYLARERGLRRIVLIEKESGLLRRASYNNQARVHNGYHYPRSFTTAYRSRMNYPRFLQDWSQAVSRDCVSLYAIARHNSKVTAKQFQRYCISIGARISPAEKELEALFEPRLIEKVFQVEESVFDSEVIAERADYELRSLGIDVRFNACAKAINRLPGNRMQVVVQWDDGVSEAIDCNYVFNCAYSGINQLGGDFPGIQTKLKHEATEIALVEVDAPLDQLGITVLDGSFFSMLPFPGRGLHTLSHVRYSPHFSWIDERNSNPYLEVKEYEWVSRADRMLRDAGRYLPVSLRSR